MVTADNWGTVGISFREAAAAIQEACQRINDAVARIPPDELSEPPNRTERRQQASPRYVRAASHGADGQRARAHKAWRDG